MQVIIGITAGEVIDNGYVWAPPVQGQTHTYIDSVARTQATPLVIPFVDSLSNLRRLYELCDAIVFSGGNDIDPNLYNEEQSELTVHVSTRRDQQELQLLEWATADNKPVFGICRGMQLLNVSKGGNLYQDLASQVPTANDHQLSRRNQSFAHIAHALRIDTHSQLGKILETQEIGTNALHHQGIKAIGQGIIATAWSEDGIIEAIEAPHHYFAVGVQSHPEALAHEVEPRWQRIFDGLAEAAFSRSTS